MRQLVSSLVLIMVTVAVSVLPAQAGLEWCPADPVVKIDGTRLSIVVSIPQKYVRKVNGPTRVEIVTPEGVRRQLISTDPGFNGYGERVVFRTDPDTIGAKAYTKGRKSVPVEIRVSVPMHSSIDEDDVPVILAVLPANAKSVVARGSGEETDVSLKVVTSRSAK